MTTIPLILSTCIRNHREPLGVACIVPENNSAWVRAGVIFDRYSPLIQGLRFSHLDDLVLADLELPSWCMIYVT